MYFFCQIRQSKHLPQFLGATYHPFKAKKHVMGLFGGPIGVAYFTPRRGVKRATVGPKKRGANAPQDIFVEM